jgi:hypothetical protein
MACLSSTLVCTNSWVYLIYRCFVFVLLALGFLLYFWEMSVALPLLPFWYVGLYSAFDLFLSLVDIKIVSFHFNS